MGRQIRDALKKLLDHLHLLSWVGRVVREFRAYLAGIMALNIVQMLMGIFFSVYVKHLIDSSAEAGIVNRLVLYAVLLTLWTVGESLLDYVKDIYSVKITFSVRRKVYHAVLHARWLQLSKIPVGDLNTRISDDSAEIARFACDSFPSLTGAALQLLATAVIIYRVQPGLLALLLAGGAVSAVMMLLFRLKMKPLQEATRQAGVDESSFQTELCSNLLPVKSMCREQAAENRLEGLHFRFVDAFRRRSRFSTLTGMGMNVFFNAGYLLVFAWSVLNLGRKGITYGTLSMLIALEGYIQGPVSTFVSTLPAFIRMLISSGKLEEMTRMDACEKTEDGADLPGSAFGISVRGLSFSYPDRKDAVISDFSCEIAPGSIAVITGPSGCGKTTLLQLLMHLLPAPEGAIVFADGNGRRHPAGRDVRRRIGYVPQGDTLFSGTILENLGFGLEVADGPEVRRALQICDALDFVSALPEGLSTRIGEKSKGLSVGQAQRIAIARALMARPAVLMLDEATSALDRDTEERILRAIAGMENRPTVLCVSHREAALRYADQVICLEPKQPVPLPRSAP